MRRPTYCLLCLQRRSTRCCLPEVGATPLPGSTKGYQQQAATQLLGNDRRKDWVQLHCIEGSGCLNSRQAASTTPGHGSHCTAPRGWAGLRARTPVLRKGVANHQHAGTNIQHPPGTSSALCSGWKRRRLEAPVLLPPASCCLWWMPGSSRKADWLSGPPAQPARRRPLGHGQGLRLQRRPAGLLPRRGACGWPAGVTWASVATAGEAWYGGCCRRRRRGVGGLKGRTKLSVSGLQAVDGVS